MRWTVASRMSSPLLFENVGPLMTVREPFSMRWKSLGLDQDRSGNRQGGLSRAAEPLLLGVKENPARRDRCVGVTGQGCRQEAAAVEELVIEPDGPGVLLLVRPAKTGAAVRLLGLRVGDQLGVISELLETC